MTQYGLFHETLRVLWPLGRVIYWLGNRPLLRSLSRPFVKALNSEAVIIPVHETISGPESVVLPYPMLTPLIEQASARVLMNECICRRGENCQTFPQDFGCLFLGEGVAQIRSAMGRRVDASEAIAHVEQAMEMGLVPLIVHTTFDALMLGVPYRRMLGICFCCDCCCTVQQGLRLGPPAFWDIVWRLPGLRVDIGADCVGCGECLEVCYVKALSMPNERALIDSARCKGCGRCVATCPTGAINLQLEEEVDTLAVLLDRIARRTDIGLAKERLTERAGDLRP